jgi:hypothetical protein
MSRSAAKSWWKIDLPREIAYLTNNGCGFDLKPDWKPVTYKDIFAKKKAIQECNIRYKRRHVYIKPAYIWVFYNDSWLFGGWWIYLKTVKNDYPLNFKHNTSPGLVKKIMRLYPCDILPFNFEIWAINFERTYHHEGFGRTNQGLLKCHCQINEKGDIIDVW